MTNRAAMTSPALKRVIALTAAYVLALQALFGAGGQIQVFLSENPGLCTILGFQEPGQPKHAADICALHCVSHASADATMAVAFAAIILALAGWTRAQRRPQPFALRVALAFHGRGPPV